MAEPDARCLLLAPAGAACASAPLFGLHPVERTVLAFLRAGVWDFVVVGAPEPAAHVASLLAQERCRGARVRVAGEGESLLALLGGEGAFAARADTLYDRRMIGRFVEENAGAEATVVAVDFRADALATQEGAPRIRGLRPGGVAGRTEAGADRLRAARVNASFLRAWDDAPPGARSLENACTLLARREPVGTWAAAELWQSLRPEAEPRRADLQLARRKVLAGAVGAADGIVARHVNRPLSRRITERVLSRDVKPWQLSVLSFLAVLAAGSSFAVGHATTGGVMAQLASILDGVDGEVARIRYQDSAFGGVYDALLDRIGDAALIGGMTFYAWLMGAGASAVALGFGAMAGSSLSMLVKEKYGTQFRRRYRAEREGRWRWLLLGRDGRLFLTLVAGLTGHVEAVLAYLAVGTHLHAGVRIYRIRSESVPAT
jgi:phosphatidylglycerophosphate synthase